ncbi:MAG: hypothetical protein AAGA85_04150 [Bacteroidota bacterium]
MLFVLKLAVSSACLYYIYVRLVDEPPADWRLAHWLVDRRYQLALLWVGLLLPANWYLEIIKWQRCIRPIAVASRAFAAAAVFRGLALNWVIPFGLGDFMGRMLGIPRTRASVKAIMICRTYALAVTGFFGCLSLLALYGSMRSFWTVTLFVVAVIIGACLIYLDKLYSWKDHGVLALLTTARYLIFFLQLFVLLTVVAPEVPAVVVVTGIGAVFLFRSIVPSFLGALGVREAAIVFVFSPYVPNAAPLLMASFSLWVINIVLPSLIGVWPLLVYRFKSSV